MRWQPAIRRSDNGTLWNVSGRALFWFDVCRPNDPGPLFGVAGQKLSKLNRRTRSQHQSAKIDETRFDGGVGNRQIDFLVEPINDRSGRIFRRTKTKP